MSTHEIKKIRRDIVRRRLRVARKEYVTPGLLRMTLQAEDLNGFESPSPDDHIKVFIPVAGREQAVARDFTPRSWDLEAGTLTVDFVMHEHGFAVDWARAASTGDLLEIGGPRGSTVVPDDFDWYLMVGDATALPSIARRLESLRAGVPAHATVMVANPLEQQEIQSSAAVNLRWLVSGASIQEDVATFRAELENFPFPNGDGFVWIAAEASVARELYRYITEQRRHPAGWVKAAAYWTHP